MDRKNVRIFNVNGVITGSRLDVVGTFIIRSFSQLKFYVRKIDEQLLNYFIWFNAVLNSSSSEVEHVISTGQFLTSYSYCDLKTLKIL